MNDQIATKIKPLHKTLKVNLSQQETFELFTTGIHQWWPLPIHSVGGNDAETCIFEAKQGGRIYERINDGSEAEWGQVQVWQPHEEVQFTWHPGRPAETAQQVTVRFIPIEGGTQLELIHAGWEVLADAAPATFSGYDFGWDFVLANFTVQAKHKHTN